MDAAAKNELKSGSAIKFPWHGNRYAEMVAAVVLSRFAGVRQNEVASWRAAAPSFTNV
jgi:hypothetical protein